MYQFVFSWELRFFRDDSAQKSENKSDIWVNNVCRRTESVMFWDSQEKTDLPGDILGAGDPTTAAEIKRKRRFTACFFWYRERQLCYVSVKLANNRFVTSG